MRTSKEYWQGRAIDRLVRSENRGNITAGNALKIYNEAQRNITGQIQSIFDNFANKGIVDTSLLREALTPKGKAEFLKAIKFNAQKLGLNISEVYDERYLFRLTRLEAIKEQIRLEILSIAPTEERITGNTYKTIVKDTYKSMQTDLKREGVIQQFSLMDNKTADRILHTKFFGKSFSQRVWVNVRGLSNELPTILGGALTSGTSYEKTARLLRERFDVGRFESVRLVRTETNYFNNQGELNAYNDDEIKEYEFDAVMDGRTSQVCEKHDGNRYKVSDAIVGENYPPLHPNCRSTTRPVIK
jgi:SPP1 gp7 family putative phage head morphogenesis protein